MNNSIQEATDTFVSEFIKERLPKVHTALLQAKQDVSIDQIHTVMMVDEFAKNRPLVIAAVNLIPGPYPEDLIVDQYKGLMAEVKREQGIEPIPNMYGLIFNGRIRNGDETLMDIVMAMFVRVTDDKLEDCIRVFTVEVDRTENKLTILKVQNHTEFMQDAKAVAAGKGIVVDQMKSQIKDLRKAVQQLVGIDHNTSLEELVKN